jgi:hypothetical protein
MGKRFLSFWWVVLFSLLCYIAYEQSSKWHERDFMALTFQLETLRKEKEIALSEQIKLTQQIQSQNDPAWIELTLIKELGLVPEGKTKVIFADRQDT